MVLSFPERLLFCQLSSHLAYHLHALVAVCLTGNFGLKLLNGFATFDAMGSLFFLRDDPVKLTSIASCLDTMVKCVFVFYVRYS